MKVAKTAVKQAKRIIHLEAALQQAWERFEAILNDDHAQEEVCQYAWFGMAEIDEALDYGIVDPPDPQEDEW